MFIKVVLDTLKTTNEKPVYVPKISKRRPYLATKIQSPLPSRKETMISIVAKGVFDGKNCKKFIKCVWLVHSAGDRIFNHLLLQIQLTRTLLRSSEMASILSLSLSNMK